MLSVVLLSLRALPLATPSLQRQSAGRPASSPLSLIIAGCCILFVSVGMFDLLPYRLGGPPFNLPPLLGDLIYLAFVPATFARVVAGQAIDRFGRRVVILATAVFDVTLMLVGLFPSLAAVAVA